MRDLLKHTNTGKLYKSYKDKSVHDFVNIAVSPRLPLPHPGENSNLILALVNIK